MDVTKKIYHGAMKHTTQHMSQYSQRSIFVGGLVLGTQVP